MAHLSLRLSCLALAVAALGWVVVHFSASVRVQLVGSVMRQSMRGERIPLATLVAAREKLGELSPTICHERVLWNALVLDIKWLTEVQGQASLSATDAALHDVRERALALLRCAPRHAMAWFTLSWIDILQQGPQPEALAQLGFSYELAGREAWIAKNRNPIAVRLYPLLPEHLKQQVVSEFRDLVKLRFFAEMVAIIRTADVQARGDLLASLAPVDDEVRMLFARALEEAGIEADIPGVPREMVRPWK